MSSVEELRRFLHYDPETGEMSWKLSPSHAVKSGAKIGSGLHSKGYRKVSFQGKTYMYHRVAWALHYGNWPETILDHINGDKTDNRLANLRTSNPYENGKNKVCHRSGKLFGVHKLRGKFVASLRDYKKNKVVHIGCFQTQEEASAAVFGYVKGADLSEHFSHYERWV